MGADKQNGKGLEMGTAKDTGMSGLKHTIETMVGWN